jgi:N-acetylmuramic acid 6-phosphate etherase
MSPRTLRSVTESPSRYSDLEKKSVKELLLSINQEDETVPGIVKRVIPQISRLVPKIVEKMKLGGRLFYIGAGTSGRLAIVDASECPPTFGIPFGRVIGLMAGGDKAIRKAVEFAEDDPEQGWKDLLKFKVSDRDVVIGIAASGRTPYVVGAVRTAREKGIITGCITCNFKTELARSSEFPIEVVVGPEFVTGSTRMKAGTAQKLILNMISTTTMIKLGKVKGNKMVDMRLANTKLIDRGERMIMEEFNTTRREASRLLKKHGSVRKVLDILNQRIDK